MTTLEIESTIASWKKKREHDSDTPSTTSDTETDALHHRFPVYNDNDQEDDGKDLSPQQTTSNNHQQGRKTSNHFTTGTLKARTRHPSNSAKSQICCSSGKFLQTMAGVAGNVLEWYDFAVFGYFSDVLGQVFFPPQEGHAAMIESFAVFGLAFLCRPIGGMMMGYIGDIYGRKRALEISIFLMAFPTFAMGCLPSYEMVGVWSIVFLTLVRMLQGLSVGGQLVSSLVYTCENNPKNQWGLYGSYVMAAANFGTLLGGIVSYVMRAYLTEDELRSWGWRLPFLSGILVSLCGFYLRYYGDDQELLHHDDAIPGQNNVGVSGGGDGTLGTATGATGVVVGENPIKAAFSKGNRKVLVASALVPMLWSAGFYITFVWMATFMGVLVDPPVPGAFGVNSGALFLSVCLLFPFAGMLSDVFGRYKIMLLGGISMGLLSPLMVMIISTGNATASFFAQSMMGIALSLWGAPMCAWLVESFPPSMRLTSVAVGYNLAQAIVGGSSPALATYLVDQYGLHAPGFMVSVIAAFSVCGLCMGPNAAQVERACNNNVADDTDEPRSFLHSMNGNDINDHERDFEHGKMVHETELI